MPTWGRDVAIADWMTLAWYQLLTGLAGRLRHPRAAVTLDACREGVSLHHHALGGDVRRQLVADAGPERITTHAAKDLWSWLDRDQVHLPLRVNRFPSRELNRELYYWLAAFLALDSPLAGDAALPAGVRHLLRGIATSARVLARYPGLAPRYRRLCHSELEQRREALPKLGRESVQRVHLLEAAFRHALGEARGPGDPWLREAMAAARGGSVAPVPPRWRDAMVPFLPVLLWGRPAAEVPGLRLRWLKRQVRRRPRGRTRTLAKPLFRPQARTAPPAGTGAAGEDVYPEWDFRLRRYRHDWCRVTPRSGQAPSRRLSADPQLASLVRRVHRQFHALRLSTGWRRYLEIGEEVDVDAFVDAAGDARRTGVRSTRLYRGREQRRRDLSVAVLVDASRSTSAWVGEHRVIEVARRSMIVLAEALHEIGDDFALFAFASDSRMRVRCDALKPFGGAYDAAARARLAGVEPGDYTRMGAAIRHAGERLRARAGERKLLLLVSDGRPHDPTDAYEGQYALEDTRRALQELRVQGVHCFGLTIDRRGREYLPHLFGPGHYAVYSRPESLPDVLPRLYARITSLRS